MNKKIGIIIIPFMLFFIIWLQNIPDLYAQIESWNSIDLMVMEQTFL